MNTHEQNETQPTPHLMRAGDAERLNGDPGSLIMLLADTGTTTGRLTANRSIMRAGSAGAPPHRHHRSAELFFIVEGHLDVLLDDRIVTLDPGDTLVVPAELTHAFAPPADSDADVLFVFAPGTARNDYYRLLDQAHRGQVDWQAVSESQDRFDNHYTHSDAWQVARRSAGSTPGPHQ